MNAAAVRGVCPSISEPMLTGDGWLARLIAVRALPLAAMSDICAASLEHGNGILEVTQRGSLQIRGLTSDSSGPFAQRLAAIDSGSPAGPKLMTPPLLGLDARESPQAQDVVTAVSRMLAELPWVDSLAPKVSVLIDGGGTIHLDAVPADVRLLATDDGAWHVGIDGDAHACTWLGRITGHQAPAATRLLLEQIAVHGSRARAASLLPAVRCGELNAMLGARFNMRPAERMPSRPPAEPIGRHSLRDTSCAVGIGLPFGHTRANVLAALVREAASLGAHSVRPAPDRTVLFIGLGEPAALQFTASAARADFVVAPEDPRRLVVTCSGAPACARAALATRALAPRIAAAAGALGGRGKILHLSGCAKGCAHPGAAALTIVGPDVWIVNGRASDAPAGHLTLGRDGEDAYAAIAAQISELCARAGSKSGQDTVMAASRGG